MNCQLFFGVKERSLSFQRNSSNEDELIEQFENMFDINNNVIEEMGRENNFEAIEEAFEDCKNNIFYLVQELKDISKNLTAA